ncbi:MAG: TlpA disulfide reductase family protein [Bacteroidota bacterium]
MILHKISVVLLVGLLSCNAEHNDKAVITFEENRPVEKIRLKDLNEQNVNLEKYRGKTVFINFWATWCKPCIEEMPSIANAQNILFDKGVIFVLASGESTEEINTFRNTHDYKFNYIRIDNSEELGIQALPATFIFNPDGKLVFSETGSRKWDNKSNIDLIINIAKTK